MVSPAELERLLSAMTPSERSEFFALVAAEKKEPKFSDPLALRQTAFIDDASRLKVALCTRRAGKSYAAGLMLLRDAYQNPGVSCLYVALTRASAKRILWKDVLKTIDREQGLQCRFNETELSCTLPNGSIIYLLGMDADEQEKDKALGQKFKIVVIDEAASYNVDLNEMVYGILKPATADYGGTIAMIGTPGNMKRGLFYDLTNGQDPSIPGRWSKMGWSCHRWTAFDNPSMAEKWKAEIEDLKLANPAIEQTPLFQQHYLGKWVTDDSKLVYRFDSSRNVFDELPAARHGRDRWHYVLGIDLGFNDPTAWVVCGYRDNDRTLYVLGADKKAGCDITEVADRTHKLMSRFQFDSIIIDNANKQAVEEIRRRHDIPLTPAQKQGKADFIEIMNGDFISGFIKIQRKLGVGLMDELQSLVWDERALPRREEHPGCDNHLCFVSGTLITTKRGDIPVEEVCKTDLVLTRNGWRPVEWCESTGIKETVRVQFSDGKSLIGTPDHPVWTQNRGWVQLDSLTATDVFVTSVPCETHNAPDRNAPSQQSTRQNRFAAHTTSNGGTVGLSRLSCLARWAARKPLSGMAWFGGDGRTRSRLVTSDTSRVREGGCTVQSGNTTTAQSLLDTMFTTLMETGATIASAIWSVFRPASICANTIPVYGQKLLPNAPLHLLRQEMLRVRGTHLKRAVSGTERTLQALPKNVSASLSGARSAETSLLHGWRVAEFAVERVMLGGTERVWALKISETPEYFANGVLVHNCDALLYSWRHCYQYLADTLAPNGMRAGNTQGEWVMLEYETELEKQLEEKHYQEQQLAMWGDN